MINMAGLKKASTELGRNAPTIIMEDAALELAIPSVVSRGFAGAGQNCLHVLLLLVDESVYDTVSERFISMAQKYKVGDKLDESTDMGPLINEKAAIKVETMVNEALNKGAKLL